MNEEEKNRVYKGSNYMETKRGSFFPEYFNEMRTIYRF